MQTTNRSVAFIAWGLASLFYAYQYILRVLPNVLITEVTAKYNITPGDFGDFCGIWYIGYCIIHIPLGALYDRIGPKIIMPLCIMLTIAGSLPLVFTDIWMYPLIGRAITGMGSSGAILGIFMVLRQYFPEDWFSRLVGIAAFIGLSGAIFGGQPLHYLFDHTGWNKGLLIIFGVGVVFSIASYLILPKHIVSKEERETTVWDDLKTVLQNKKIWIFAILGGCMVGPLEGFADAWGGIFLSKAYDLLLAQAIGLSSSIFIGMCFGCPIVTFIADKTQGYMRITCLAALVMGLGFVWILGGNRWFPELINVSLFYPLFILIGMLSAYQILVIYKNTTFEPERLVGITSAWTNAIMMSFGLLFHKGIGFTLDRISGGVPVENLSVDVLLEALSVVPLGQFIALIGFLPFAIKEFSKKGAQHVRA